MAARVPWRHTRLTIAELAGAAVLGIASIAIAWSSVQGWRRAVAVRDVAGDFFRGTPGGESALRSAAEGLDAFPGEPALLAARGAALVNRVARAGAEGGEAEAAEADLEKAAEAYRALAEAGDPTEEAGRRARSLGRVGLGIVAFERARRAPDEKAREQALAGAAEEAARAAKAAPRRPEPQALAGTAALARGDIEGALAAFEEALGATEPGTAGGLLMLCANAAEARLRKGDTARAVELLERAVELAPAVDPRLVPSLAERLARAIGRRACEPGLDPEARKEALERARRATLPVELRENYRRLPLYALEARHLAELRRAIGNAEARGGDLAAARRTLELALRDAPAETAQALRAAIARDLGAVLASSFLAETREAPRRELAQAGAEALIAAAAGGGAAADAETAEMLMTAGVLYARAGNPEAALTALRRVEKIAPASPRLARNMAIACDLAGRKAEAIAAYKKAIDAAPNDPAAGEMEARLQALSGGAR
jgi:tetratricopeptide (TPR) repeat protein